MILMICKVSINSMNKKSFDYEFFLLYLGVLEYAEYMGMVPIDPDLLWIAKEGFNAPLPDGWTEEFIY